MPDPHEFYKDLLSSESSFLKQRYNSRSTLKIPQ